MKPTAYETKEPLQCSPQAVKTSENAQLSTDVYVAVHDAGEPTDRFSTLGSCASP